MSSSGVERLDAQRVLAEVQNEHPSNMYGFSRKEWSKDPFYGWRTPGELPNKQVAPTFAAPQSQAASPVPPSSRTRQRELAPPSVAAPRTRMIGSTPNSRRPARQAAPVSRAQDPFAEWRSTTSGDAYVDSITAARKLAATHAADPFSAWRSQMPQADAGSGAPPRSAARVATRKDADPFGSWRPDMQQTPQTLAPSTQRVVAPQSTRQRSPVAPPTQIVASHETAGGRSAQRGDASPGTGVDEPVPAPSTSVPLLAATLRGAIQTLAPEGWNLFAFDEGSGSARGPQAIVGEKPARKGEKASKFGGFC